MQCMSSGNQAVITQITTTSIALYYEDREVVREEEPEVVAEYSALYCGECGSDDIQQTPQPRKEQTNARVHQMP